MSDWSAYGRWRSVIYGDVSLSKLSLQLKHRYSLTDIKVVSIDQQAFKGISRIECVYPVKIKEQPT